MVQVSQTLNNRKIINLLQEEKVGVIPTDTLYGIVGKTEASNVVKRIYRLKNRNTNKPVLVLAASVDQIEENFQVTCPEIVKTIWPKKISIILPCKDHPYIHRGKETIGFRVPEKKNLINLLKQSGPLVAPSANLQNKPPAKTINKAQDYFGDSIEFYVDEGKLNSLPSTILQYQSGEFEIIRRGAVNPKPFL